MLIFRPRHENIAASPVRTLYGRKGNLLLAPLDLCVLLTRDGGGGEDFRTSLPAGRFVAAPVQEAGASRVGLIAQYQWPPALPPGDLVNPVVTVQAAPSADVRAVPDVERIAAQADVGDLVYLDGGGTGGGGAGGGTGGDSGDSGGVERIGGVVRHLIGRHPYPDLAHRVEAYRVDFWAPVPKEAHGSAVRLFGGALLGMLIATDNQPDNQNQPEDPPEVPSGSGGGNSGGGGTRAGGGGTCRALVYPV